MINATTAPAQFIGDPLIPDPTSLDAARMATGEPGLPGKFRWRDQTVEVLAVVRAWRETGSCSHGSDERYVQKHWYELETNHGTMRVFFERKPRGGSPKARWWLYSMKAPGVAIIAQKTRLRMAGHVTD